MNALIDKHCMGCQWRMLPADVPPFDRLRVPPISAVRYLTNGDATELSFESMMCYANMHLYGTMLLKSRMNKKDLQLFQIAGQGFDLPETRWNARLLEQCVDSAETLSAID